MAERAVIIGSGFAGLAAAIRLRVAGYETTLIERRPKVGGRAYQFKEAGFTFDMGPSLVTLPSLFRDLFTLAGGRLDDHVKLVPLEPYYRIYFPNAAHTYEDHLDYGGDAVAMRRELAKLDPRDGERYDAFLAAIDPIFRAGYLEYGRKPFLRLWDFLSIVPRMGRVGAVRSIHSFMANKFHDVRNRQAMGFQSLFLGGNPLSVPAIYAMLPAIERYEGVWYAMGGMYSLVQALADLYRRLGGVLRLSAEVTEITVEDGRASGVRLTDGTQLPADLVLSNADTSHTYEKLLKPEYRRHWTNRRVRRMKRGMSLFLLYLGTDRKYEKLLHHTLIFGEHYLPALKTVFFDRDLPQDLHIYAHAPSRTDPSMAPPGGDSLYFLVPAPLTGKQDWSVSGPALAERVIDFLEHDFGLTDLRAHVRVQRTFVPSDFESELLATEGSAFSFEPSLRQSAYFRPHNRSEDIPNLYLVGAGTHPGAGVPGVLLSAAIAADLILGRRQG